MKNIVLIYNPTSGNEGAHFYVKKIERHLKKYFDEVFLEETKGPNDATNFAKKYSELGFDSIAVYGGDGTINEVLLGMYRAKSKSKLCVFPGGTGNLLAQSFGISQIKDIAIRSMKFEKTKKINLGICNDKVFSMFASIGPVPEAIHEVSVEDKTRYGNLAYAKKSMDKMKDSVEYELEVTGDENHYSGHVDHVIVSITNKVGKFKITDEMNEEKAMAKVLILSDDSIIKKISVIGSALAGMAEKNENLDYFESNEIEIRSSQSEKINIDLDGDKGPELPVKIEVLKDFIEVYLPSNLLVSGIYQIESWKGRY